MGTSSLARACALAAATTLTGFSLASPAVAGQSGGHTQHGHQGQHGQAHGANQGAGKGKGAHHGQGQSGASHGQSGASHGQSGASHGQSGASHGQSGASHGQSGQSHGQSGASHGSSSTHGGAQQGSQHGNPPGNNGTVKIAAPSDAVGQPSNNPHPGCTVVVEWFGYDQGSDVTSTVTFASQAPTSDAVIGGTSPSQVFVGGDPAGGGTDLDGRQAYTPTFTGTPHPKQGFHVKLTVATPHSLGNDTKTKVFWVQPCTDAATPGGPGAGTTPGAPTGETPHTPGQTTPGQSTPGQETPGQNTPGTPEQGVSAGEASAPGTSTGVTGGTAGAAGSQGTSAGSAAVPTSVDAGENSALPQWVRSPWPLAAIAAGLALAGVALVRRNRARA